MLNLQIVPVFFSICIFVMFFSSTFFNFLFYSLSLSLFHTLLISTSALTVYTPKAHT